MGITNNIPMREWNAETYHRVSNPQFTWGLTVMDRLPLAGDETVADVGCGSGRLTDLLVRRLPRGRVVAVDGSENMLRSAHAFLRPRHGTHVAFIRADAAALPLAGAADAIFSTATFHWVLDHERLFRSLFVALRPGGRLVAQCGGGPNIRRIRDRAAALLRESPFAPYFAGWRGPWLYADADVTARRLTDAGFSDVATSLQAEPTIMPDEASFREFITNVICHPYLAVLPAGELRARFVDSLTAQAARDDPPFELDYWRLNIQARKPASA
jgi:trans-aconitate methyltransferase